MSEFRTMDQLTAMGLDTKVLQEELDAFKARGDLHSYNSLRKAFWLAPDFIPQGF